MNIKISEAVLRVNVAIIVLILFYKLTCLGEGKFCKNIFVPNSSDKLGSNMVCSNQDGRNTFYGNIFGINSPNKNIANLETEAGQLKNFKIHNFRNKTVQPVIERVTIYSQKSENSNEKIIRKGILAKPKNAKANVLMCHGFTCDKNDIGFMRYIFKNCNCLTFDFRAHGENIDGQYCTLGKNEAYDVIAAAKFLKAHPDTKDKPILVYAFSMGAVAAIEAQAKDSTLFDAMVLDCPFDSTENVINRGLDNKKMTVFGYEFDIPGKAILRKYVFHPYVQSFVKAMLRCAEQINGKSVNTFVCPVNTAESIKKVKVPCLFILCKNDEKISIDNIKSVYYNAASSYKKLWITEGKRHFGSFFNNPEEYADKVGTFVCKFIDGQLYQKNKHRIIEDPSEVEDIKGSTIIVEQKKVVTKVEKNTKVAVSSVLSGKLQKETMQKQVL